MKYIVKPGIAACQLIYPPKESPQWKDTGYPDAADHYHAIYLGPELLDPHGDIVQRVQFDRPTPDNVKAVVNRNFGMLFSVPAHRRQALINAMLTEEVEVQP